MADRSGVEASPLWDVADVVIVAIIGFWTVLRAFGQVPGGESQVLLGLLSMLFAPGYALIATVFPARGSPIELFDGHEGNSDLDSGTVAPVERFVLAVGLSVCIVPLIGLGVAYTSGGVRASSVLAVTGVVTVGLSVTAAISRMRIPPEERFRLRFLPVTRDIVTRIRDVRTRSVLTPLLVVGLVVAGAGIGFAVLDTERGEQFTAFSITTEDSETGEAVAAGYPDTIREGSTGNVSLSITNEEGDTMNYTVVVLLQSFDESGDVREVQKLDAFRVTVSNGETVRERHTIRPNVTGEDLRVTYLLYKGEPPTDTEPGADDGYRQVHFWVDVPPSTSP